MKEFSKSTIKTIVRNVFGVDVVSRQVFGQHLSRDLLTILSDRNKPLIFDIGANRGDASVEFASLYKGASIHCFEPDPATYTELEARVRLFQKKIKTYNFGFGSTPGSQSLNISKSSGGNSFLEVSRGIGDFALGSWTEPVGKVDSEIKTLNGFCKENGIQAIDLLKIDTQGYELEILKGGDEVVTAERVSVIYIEVLFVELYEKQAYFHEVYRELNQRGFKLIGLYNRFYKTENPHFLLWCDALFVSEKYKA